MRLTPRWILFLAFLAAGTLLTILFWPHGLFLFLVFPFLFRWPRRHPPPRACPRCGYATVDPEDRFCPRDGTRLHP
jgi:hypothetical protein